MKGVFQVPNINSHFKTAKLFAFYKFYYYEKVS